MTLDEMLAREGIRATMARYTNAGDNGDYDELLLCYAEDGVFEVVTGQWRGRQAVGDALRQMRGARSRAGELQRHLLGTCHIVLEDADNANANTYFSVISEVGLDHFGRYIDRLVRRDGCWQFAHRNVVVEWISPESPFAKAGARRN